MKRWLANLFSEAGSVSMMRVLAFQVCSTACYIAVTQGEASSGIVLGMITAALGAKVGQKLVEGKTNVNGK